MPNAKENLVELLNDVCAKGFWRYGVDQKTGEEGGHEMTAEDIADYLMENGVPVQKWIPVTERLPKHFGCFIVAIRNPNSERLGVDSADFDPLKKYWYPSMCWDKGYEVTHWMPLPKPPKGE